jgi:hydrogenase expression/formation protein HypC
MGHIDFGGVVVHVCLEYVPELQVGEYAIVHVGFALHRIDEVEAQRTWKILAELGLMRDALAELQPTADPLVPLSHSDSSGNPISSVPTRPSRHSDSSFGATEDGGFDALLG